MKAKKLIKKYPSLKEKLKVLGEQLSLNPELGSPIGNSCYKIRLQITSKGNRQEKLFQIKSY